MGYTFDDPADDGMDDEGLAASGDSGGPAMIKKDGTYHIAGVNSGGTCCEFGSKDQYKRIADNWDWVKSTVAKDGVTLSGTTTVT